MPVFDRNGWRLFYEDAGEGPPVLLVHGLFMDHTMFDPMVGALAGRYRLIRPDLRGHGRSEHRVEERTLWDVMEDQVALLDALGIGRAVWGGASVAGPIALRAALRHPDRVAGLILISTQAGPEHPKRLPAYAAWADAVATQGWTEELLAGSAATNFGRSAAEETRQHWMERWRAQPVDDVGEIMRSLTRRESLLERLGDVHVPALVVYGEEDGLALQLDEVEHMVRALPEVSSFVRITGAGHSPTIERPEAVAAAVSTFLDSLSL
jgi:pimeloyl-ACP methyl ester carboxylesterase